MLTLPDRFNKNAPEVQAMGSPAETGASLIRYMCARAGLGDLGAVDVLDFGCGCRFAQALVNLDLPVKSYTGIDVDEEMIDYLAANIADPRFRFHPINARNPLYNPDGEPLTADYSLPVGPAAFDLICMFSVITHQQPDDAAAIFQLLRRYVRAGGQLFFSAKVDQEANGYREIFPDRPTVFSAYSIDLLSQIVEAASWKIVSVEPPPPETLRIPIQTSLLCAAA